MKSKSRSRSSEKNSSLNMDAKNVVVAKETVEEKKTRKQVAKEIANEEKNNKKIGKKIQKMIVDNFKIEFEDGDMETFMKCGIKSKTIQVFIKKLKEPDVMSLIIKTFQEYIGEFKDKMHRFQNANKEITNEVLTEEFDYNLNETAYLIKSEMMDDIYYQHTKEIPMYPKVRPALFLENVIIPLCNIYYKKC